MHRVGLHEPFQNSNHLTPTKNSGFLPSGTPFFKLKNPLSDTVVKRKPLKSLSGYPYREARIVPATLDITKRWYIVFYAWDIGTETLERKRVLQDELAQFTSFDDRKKAAEGIVDEINYFLKHDWHLFSSPAPTIMGMDFKGYSILDGLRYSVKIKLEVDGISEETGKKYSEVIDTVKGFLEFKKLSTSYALRNMNAAFVNQYMNYVKQHRGNANNTYNFKKGTLHTLCGVLIRQNPKLWNGINPFGGVPVLQVQVRKHAAYTDQQLQALIEHAKKKEWFQIVLFIQFMYYSLARGKELAMLKVGHIHMGMRRILFYADGAKTNIEEYIGISDRFAEIIEASGILKFPPNYYVFSNENGNHGPGETKVGKGYFYKRVRECLQAQNLYDINPNFTPYSVKHTGAIRLYLDTRNINLVMRQCRHKELDTTIKYLRDLGVFTEFDELNKMKGAI